MATRVGTAREGWVTMEMMGTSGERTSERMRETSLDRFCGERVPATTVTRLNAQGTTYEQSYLPAAYIETGASHDNIDAVTRPAAAAIPPVRSSDIDLEAKPAKQNCNGLSMPPHRKGWLLRLLKHKENV
jgi:hypothetical protein